MRCVGPILIVDDDEHMRELLSHLLEGAGYETIEAASGETALLSAQERSPALVVLDVHLGGVSGYEVCRQLREQFGERLPIVFVSGERTEPHDRAAGLMIGADDYVTKPFSPDELVARVRRLLVRTTAEEKDRDRVELAAPLTRREGQVLDLMAAGLSQKAIAARMSISPRTVATHVQHIFVKLDVHTQAAAVAHAYRTGIVKETPAPNGVA